MLLRETWFSFDSKDGQRLTSRYLTAIEFDPETMKIKGTQQYSDSILEQFLPPHLGVDYGNTPGVIRLNTSTDPVSRAEMVQEINTLKG